VPRRWQTGWQSLAGSSLAQDTVWNGMGTVAARGANILATIAVARVLGPTGFGALGILFATVAAVST
jgi:O-antigen/teichoic acid export membrane protein